MMDDSVYVDIEEIFMRLANDHGEIKCWCAYMSDGEWCFACDKVGCQYDGNQTPCRVTGEFQQYVRSPHGFL